MFVFKDGWVKVFGGSMTPSRFNVETDVGGCLAFRV